MKLYTEEQVVEMIEKSRLTGLTADYLIATRNGIELPSEEKIEKEAIYFSDSHSIYDTAKDDTLYGFREGAKWVIEKIIKQK